MKELIYFVLGLSIMLNIALIFILIKFKEKFELKEAIVDEEINKDFEKEDKTSWNSFFSNK